MSSDDSSGSEEVEPSAMCAAALRAFVAKHGVVIKGAELLSFDAAPPEDPQGDSEAKVHQTYAQQLPAARRAWQKAADAHLRGGRHLQQIAKEEKELQDRLAELAGVRQRPKRNYMTSRAKWTKGCTTLPLARRAQRR